MHDPALLEQTCELLERRYGERGRDAARRLRRWLSGELPFAYPEVLERHLGPDHLDLLFDAFWQDLPFGTGGRRGRVGYGPNRINPTTVAMTVQGHCDRLKAAWPDRDELAVVVANDVRVFRDSRGVYGFLGDDHPLLGLSARSLARLAARIYAANGIVAYMAEPESDEAVIPTPFLSFLIHHLGAVGGINVSASHNPPDDNGVKVYDRWGSQPVAPEDQALIDAMRAASEVRIMDFDEALERGLVRAVPGDALESYLSVYVERYGDLYRPEPGDPPVVYTPLCGTGLVNAGALLRRMGVRFEVPPGQGPDGSFAAIPLKAPNPEVPASTRPAQAFAEEIGASIVLSSDPDADRVGVEVRLEDGSWVHLDGDQIAAILAYFLMLDPEGPRLRGLVIETLVTTRLLGRIVEARGDSCIVDDLLVGFKYIADVLRQLDEKGAYGELRCRSDELVMGTEESHGIQVIPWIRDKDSAPAVFFLAALHLRLQRRGSNLLDYYVRILEELGGFDTAPRSIMLSGAEGLALKDAIMASLRERPFTEIDGQPVREHIDHWDTERFGPFKSETEKLPRNVIQYVLDRYVVTVRPSGTEPKLKLYCQLLPGDEPPPARGRALLAALREETEAFARRFYNALLARVGLSLGEAALRLPDIVDHGQKHRFEAELLPALREGLAAGRWGSLDELLGWLRGAAGPLVPGADPLPALREALAWALGQWRAEGLDAPLAGELARWAGAA